MKKLFTILALLMAFTVSGVAGNYYVVGNLTQWTYKPSAEGIDAMALLEGTEDTYYADYTPEAGDQYFCIATGDATSWDEFNSTENDYRYSVESNVTNGCYSVQLGSNGDKALIINADGNTTYRVMFVESTKMLTVTKVGLDYVVGGSFTPDGGEEEAGFFGTMWDASANSLTLQNDGTYAITFSDVELPVGKITYKVAKKDDWNVATSVNQEKSITEEGTYDITFVFYVNNLDGPVCKAVKQGAKHKIYVKNMQTDDVPLLYYWTPTDGPWPGVVMTATTVDGEDGWYVYETETTSLVGRFVMYGENEWSQSHESGGLEFDLSEGDLFYYYYPNSYQAVLKDEALSEAAKLYIHANNGDETLKWEEWTPGISFDKAHTVETVGGVEWHVFEIWKPTVNLPICTYHNDSGNDYNWDTNYNLESGQSYFYHVQLAGPKFKLDTKYYLVYGEGNNGWEINPEKSTVTALEMNANSEMEFNCVLDNTEGKLLHYVIVPASAIEGNNITDWNSVIGPKFDEEGYFVINKFESHTSDTFVQTWKRWKIEGVAAKYDVTFNFATLSWESKPYVEITAPDTDYITYSYSKNIGVNIGKAEAYIVTGVNGGEVVLTKLDENADIPANTGILLKGAESYKIYGSTYGAETADVSANMLIGSGEYTYDITGNDGTKDYTAYILADGADGVGFYIMQSEGNKTLGEHKAFLAVPKTTAGEAPFLGFGDGEGTTGIGLTPALSQGEGVWYDLSGRRVENPTKGLYIVNGKKVLVP